MSPRSSTCSRRTPAPALKPFLNPVFQIQRTNGVRQDKASYRATPAFLSGYKLSQFRVTRSATTIVVTYWIAVQGSVIEGEAYTVAPNLSIATFQFDNGKWTMLSYANFNKPSRGPNGWRGSSTASPPVGPHSHVERRRSPIDGADVPKGRRKPVGGSI